MVAILLLLLLSTQTSASDWEFFNEKCQHSVLKPAAKHEMKACSETRCEWIPKHSHCRSIVFGSPGMQQGEQNPSLNNIMACPNGFGFVGYCVDYRGVNEKLRICKKGVNNRAKCAGADHCTWPMFEGDGDCDEDTDCAGYMKCGHHNCRSMNPGSNCFDSTDDCCKKVPREKGPFEFAENEQENAIADTLYKLEALLN